MKTVPLRGKKAAGRLVQVDDGDYDLVMQYGWHVKERRRPRRTDGPYAVTGIYDPSTKRMRQISMHKMLTGYPRTDHIDHNGLNNQRSNLRPATNAQNGANRRPVQNHSSQYKGVRWYPPMRKWVARIQHNGKLRHIGYFASEEAAARAYDAEARRLFGEYANPNFKDATVLAEDAPFPQSG